ncbi:MAG: hypothetical protein KJ052_20405 [Candidatus Hydrogenedentes bacterium]|nr:hypothetical protein [Candidatus Hydrogenedentota bacterium]
MMGQNQTQPVNVTSTMTAAVDSITPEGVVKLNMRVESLGLPAAAGMGEMMGGMGGLENLSTALNNAEFTAEILPNGKVYSVTGLDQKVREAVSSADLGAMGQLMPAADLKKFIQEMMREVMGDEVVQEQLTAMLAYMSPQPVDVGDIWTTSYSMKHQTPFVATNTYTLRERRDGISVIDYTSELTPNTEAASLSLMQGMSIERSFQGTVSGTIEVEEATGWPVKNESKVDISGTQSMNLMGGINLDVQMTVEGTVNTTVTKE